MLYQHINQNDGLLTRSADRCACLNTNSARTWWYYLFEKQITLSSSIKRNTKRCCKSFYPSYWSVCRCNNLYVQKWIGALLDIWWKRQKCSRLTSLAVSEIFVWYRSFAVCIYRRCVHSVFEEPSKNNAIPLLQLNEVEVQNYTERFLHLRLVRFPAEYDKNTKQHFYMQDL